MLAGISFWQIGIVGIIVLALFGKPIINRFATSAGDVVYGLKNFRKTVSEAAADEDIKNVIKEAKALKEELKP